MLAVISPAKTMDFETKPVTEIHTMPSFLDQSQALIDILRKMSVPDLAQLMRMSVKLAELNFERYAQWHTPFTPDNAKQAALCMKGDVYSGLDAESFTPDDFAFAQDHLRILSGLYGLLRPLDLMQAYRLEMGTRLESERGKDLYAFWGGRITLALNRLLAERHSRVLINLASNEYFKAVRTQDLQAHIVTPHFKELKSGGYRTIGLFAKKARGLMSRFMIKNRIDDAAALKDFAEEGYRFDAELSSDNDWVFTRG